MGDVVEGEYERMYRSVDIEKEFIVFCKKSPDIYHIFMSGVCLATLNLNADTRATIVSHARKHIETIESSPSPILLRFSSDVFTEEDIKDYCAHMAKMYFILLHMRLKKLHVERTYDHFFSKSVPSVKFAAEGHVFTDRMLADLLAYQPSTNDAASVNFRAQIVRLYNFSHPLISNTATFR